MPTAYDESLRGLLDCVPAVAATLLGLRSAAGRPLRAVGKPTAAAYAAGGSVSGWEAELLGADDPIPRQTLDAARFCAAAGVRSWQRLADVDGREAAIDRLAGRLRAVLPLCREPGTRAGVAAGEPAEVTRRFVADLYEADDGRLG